MRKISDMQIAVLDANHTARDYVHMCTELVHDGYTPYGKPYKHGDYLLREFVKYEYVESEDGLSFEEDEVNSDPWENHDFFEEIETDE